MGNFIAKAFVKIKKRSLLTKCDETLLNHLKYNLYGFRNVLADYLYIMEGDYCFSMIKFDDVSIDYIDCNFYANGDEDLAVKLFLELAQMRDCVFDGQWLVWSDAPYTELQLIKRNICYKGILYCDENEEYQTYEYDLYRAATPLELAEAVMRGNIKL